MMLGKSSWDLELYPKVILTYHCQRRISRVLIARLEKPPKDMLVLSHICITAVALYTRVKLADASRYLLVPYTDIRIALFSNKILWRRYELRKSTRSQ